MNHRPRVYYLTYAIIGFLQYKSAEGLSPATIFNYECDLLAGWVEAGWLVVGDPSLKSRRYRLSAVFRRSRKKSKPVFLIT